MLIFDKHVNIVIKIFKDNCQQQYIKLASVVNLCAWFDVENIYSSLFFSSTNLFIFFNI